MGAPLAYDVDQGFFSFREIAEAHDPDDVIEAFGVAPKELLVAGFLLRKPVEYLVTNPANVYDRFDDDEFVEHFARKLIWAFDPVDLAGEKYREIVEELLQDNRLMRGELVLDERPVDLSGIDVPVVIIQGRDDKFVPPSSSLPFLDAISSDDTEVIEFPTGHVGMAVDEISHATYWPRVAEWFAERSS